MITIILDTNMYLSALVYGGMAEKILDCIVNNQLQLYVSLDLKREVLKKFTQVHATKEILDTVRYFMDYKGILIDPTVVITACRDPKDNFLLELAQTSNADYLITRDKDLLHVFGQKWKNTKIVKPEDFLKILRHLELL